MDTPTYTAKDSYSAMCFVLRGTDLVAKGLLPSNYWREHTMYFILFIYFKNNKDVFSFCNSNYLTSISNCHLKKKNNNNNDYYYYSTLYLHFVMKSEVIPSVSLSCRISSNFPTTT